MPHHRFPSDGAKTLATTYSRTSYTSTTIGAMTFHFRVRNGNGWGHCAKVTRNLAELKTDLNRGVGLRLLGGPNRTQIRQISSDILASFAKFLSKNNLFSDIYIQVSIQLCQDFRTENNL